MDHHVEFVVFTKKDAQHLMYRAQDFEKNVVDDMDFVSLLFKDGFPVVKYESESFVFPHLVSVELRCRGVGFSANLTVIGKGCPSSFRKQTIGGLGWVSHFGVVKGMRVMPAHERFYARSLVVFDPITSHYLDASDGLIKKRLPESKWPTLGWLDSTDLPSMNSLSKYRACLSKENTRIHLGIDIANQGKVFNFIKNS